jgi:hypothetical protein
MQRNSWTILLSCTTHLAVTGGAGLQVGDYYNNTNAGLRMEVRMLSGSEMISGMHAGVTYAKLAQSLFLSSL